MTKIKKGFAEEQMEQVKSQKTELGELYITQLNKLYDKSQELEHQLLVSRLLTVLITGGIVVLLPIMLQLLNGTSNTGVHQYSNVVVTMIYIMALFMSVAFMVHSMIDVLAIYIPIVRIKLMRDSNDARLVSLELREVYKLQSMVDKYISEEIDSMRKMEE